MTTSVTAAMLLDVRRKANEPTAVTYTDAMLVTVIEKYPMIDRFGEEQYNWIGGVPPTAIANTEWIPTFDLNAAVADVWDEKASTVAANYDFNADGGSYQRSQQYQMYCQQARSYRSRRALKTTKVIKSPEEPAQDTEWIFNVNDPYE